MKTTAAVLVELGRPLEVVELDIPALKSGQVLVELAYSGVCHTQLLEARGHRGEDRFLPHCLGHEGSGTVREIGIGVNKVKPGDNVILSWIKGTGADVPGSVYGWNGRSVNAGAITTFATHSVISENRLTVIPEGLSMRHAALVGCAVPTGAGVVFNTAQPRPGQSLAVFGIGGVGSCAVAAAALCGCYPVIAVDVNSDKLALACQLGATHVVNPKRGDPVQEIPGLCKGGADYAVEATGNPIVMRQSLACVRPQGGAAVIVGNAKHGQSLEIDPRELNQGKRLLGTWGGDNMPDRDYPRYGKLIAAGKLNVEPLLGRTYSLLDANAALDDLERGLCVRPLIEMKGVLVSRNPNRSALPMLIGLDFDNTIVCYDRLFHLLAVERSLIPRALPPTKQAVRDFLRAAGREDDWTELQGIAYGPRIVDAEPFPGVKQFLSRSFANRVSVVIVSHKTRYPYRGEKHDLHAAAQAFLELHGFYEWCNTGLTPDRVFLEHTLEAKLARIQSLACDTFVDDLPEVLSNPAFPSTVRKVLFDPADATSDDPGYTRVLSWNSCSDALLTRQEVCA